MSCRRFPSREEFNHEAAYHVAGIVPVARVSAVKDDLRVIELEKFLVGLTSQFQDLGTSRTECGQDEVVTELVVQTSE